VCVCVCACVCVRACVCVCVYLQALVDLKRLEAKTGKVPVAHQLTPITRDSLVIFFFQLVVYRLLSAPLAHELLRGHTSFCPS
jgi:hypothetical protein